jgi:leader peptidase (prepilin peptidase)/N-methyltransferase
MDTSTYLMPLLAVYAFLWGAIWGSFLNVVVYRLPRGMSLSRPGSHCPVCSTPIRWYDNLPVVGWVHLRGRCRACGTRIPARYPGVELGMACMGLALWWHVGADGRAATEPVQVLGMVFLLHFFFVFAMAAIAWIDWDLTIIPDRLTVPTMAWGLLAALLTPKTGPWIHYLPSVDIVDSVIGGVAGASLVLAVHHGYRWVTGRVGLGGGDVTMMAAIGAYLGWMSLPVVLFLASMQGLLAAGAFALIERVRPTSDLPLLRGADRPSFWDSDSPGRPVEEPEDADTSFMRMAIPFGPFLALAAVEVLLFSAWLLPLFGFPAHGF